MANDELWVGTYHGHHDGAPATATATRDDTRPEPYAWTCTCGAFRNFPTEHGLARSAWQHTHPTLRTRMRQWAVRRLRTRTTTGT